MNYPYKILYFSLITENDFLEIILRNTNFAFQTYNVNSVHEANYLLENESLSFVVLDESVLTNISLDWIPKNLTLYKNVSFILYAENLSETECIDWLDLGFSDVANSFLSLKISIKREIRTRKILEEYQNNQQSLKQSSQFLRLVLDHVPAGIFWKDKKSRYMGCNKLHATAMGLKSTDDIIGKLDNNNQYLEQKLELFRKDDLKVINENKKVFRITYSNLNRDGSDIWTETTKVPIQNENGDTIGILGLYKDITEQKLLENKLIEKEEYYRSLIENLSEGIIVYDSDLDIILTNASTEKITGFTLNDLNQGLHKESGAILLNDKEEVISKSYLPHIISHKTGKVCKEVEIGFLYPNKKEQWIRLSSVPIFDKHSVISRIITTLSDVTDTRKNRQRLHETELLYTNIFSVMKEAIIVLNSNREFVVCNSSGEQFLDIANSLRENYGKLGLVNEQLIEIPEEEFPSRKTFQTGKPCIDSIVGIPRGTKEYQWIMVNTQPIFSSDGKNVRQVVVSMIDITEKRRIQSELFTKKKLEAIGNMASEVVHNFYNVLQPINIYSDLIQSDLEELGQAAQKENLLLYTDRISKATKRGKKMIDQILKIAQKNSEPKQLIDLKKLIEENIDDLKIIIRGNINIQFLTDLQLAEMEANPTDMYQVFSNIFNNSVHAMANQVAGTLSIELNRKQISQELRSILNETLSQCTFEIIIRDNGQGIKQENLEKIFEPFFTTKQKDGGTGLGLASVYAIIQSLNGNISVASKEGVGTKFTIYLPCPL